MTETRWVIKNPAALRRRMLTLIAQHKLDSQNGLATRLEDTLRAMRSDQYNHGKAKRPQVSRIMSGKQRDVHPDVGAALAAVLDVDEHQYFTQPSAVASNTTRRAS